MSTEFLIIAMLLVPLIGYVAINCFSAYPNIRETVTLITAFSLLLIVIKIYLLHRKGMNINLELWQVIPGLSLAFSIEPLGILFALTASFLWCVTSIYSIGYMRAHHEKNQTRFYGYFALALASVMGIASSANMFTLFIFYEFLTICTYPLVIHSGDDNAKRSGRIYLGCLLGTSIMLQLLAIIWTWSIAGTLDFRSGGILQGKASDTVIMALLALYIFGIGKVALMPLHRWLPAAMVAPTPVSALLHAVAVVKAGAFTVVKITVYLFGIDLLAISGASEWLLYIATATILFASLIALRQDNLKARLAYSTISQLSYIVLGAMLASSAGILGGSMHIAMHAFGKITLFFCAGAIMISCHQTKISKMHGLGKAMPFTMFAFLIGSLSVIGMPPAGGMWSKWFLVTATLEAQYYIPLIVLLLSSLLNVAYLLPIPIYAFFSSNNQTDNKGLKEAPLPCLIAMAITSLGCIVLFFYPQFVYELIGSIDYG